MLLQLIKAKTFSALGCNPIFQFKSRAEEMKWPWPHLATIALLIISGTIAQWAIPVNKATFFLIKIVLKKKIIENFYSKISWIFSNF